MSVPQRVLGALLVTLLLAIGLVLGLRGSSNGDSATAASTSGASASAGRLVGPLMPPGLRAADFTLTDPRGRPVSLAQDHGRVVVLTFIHSLCQGACPLMAEQIKGALNDLPGRGRQVAAIGVSVEPAQDTPRNRLAFLRKHDLLGRLAYLNGPLAEMRHVWHEYAIAPNTSGEDHSAFVFLIDRRGILRVGYPVSSLTPEDLAHDIRLLEAERA